MTLNLLPIALSLSAKSFEKKQKQGSDGMIVALSAFDPNADEDTRKHIFERDKNTCQYCGFESQKFHLVHDRSTLDLSSQRKLGSKEIPDQVRDDKDSHLVTSCIFCNQCFHLDDVSTMKSGTLIWMPELLQAQVHHLARSIYVARITQGPLTEVARNALEMVMKRREEALERLKTDDPHILSLVLKDYVTKSCYDRREEKLDGIRLFPLDRRVVKEGDLEFNQFPQILAYWRSKDGPFADLNPKDWISHYADLKAA